MRTEFIQFLEALLRGRSTLADWQRFIVNHYQDEDLERVRRELVRKVVEANSTDFSRPPTSVAEAIPEWIERLRR